MTSTTNATYSVGSDTFTSFSAAVSLASERQAEVIEIETGKRRWHPAPPVSEARMRRFREGLNARKAYLTATAKTSAERVEAEERERQAFLEDEARREAWEREDPEAWT